MRRYYDLDALYAISEGDFLRWLVRQGSSFYLGDVLGDLFADAVLTDWQYAPIYLA